MTLNRAAGPLCVFTSRADADILPSSSFNLCPLGLNCAIVRPRILAACRRGYRGTIPDSTAQEHPATLYHRQRTMAAPK